MSRDEYYADRDSRFDTIAGPDHAAYWRMLARLSDAYEPEHEIHVLAEHEKDNVFGMPKKWNHFSDWCDELHGFRPQFDTGGGITGQPQITDEPKYTLCVLKYGG